MDAMGCECASLVIAAVRAGRSGLIIFVRTGLTPDAPVVVASPSDASPEALASPQATSRVGRATRHALHVPGGPLCRDDF